MKKRAEQKTRKNRKPPTKERDLKILARLATPTPNPSPMRGASALWTR